MTSLTLERHKWYFCTQLSSGGAHKASKGTTKWVMSIACTSQFRFMLKQIEKENKRMFHPIVEISQDSIAMLQINDADIYAIIGCRSAHEAVRFWVETASIDQELTPVVPRLLHLLQQNPSRTCGIALQKTSVSLWSNILIYLPIINKSIATNARGFSSGGKTECFHYKKWQHRCLKFLLEKSCTSITGLIESIGTRSMIRVQDFVFSDCSPARFSLRDFCKVSGNQLRK